MGLAFGRFKSLHRIIRFLYIKLLRINDSPQKIALGFALGVFLGIIPGTGVLASFFLAYLCRVNRASAVLGSLLTNTWLSFLTFIIAIKLGSSLLRIEWEAVYKGWLVFFKHWNWAQAAKGPFFNILFPIILGYAIIGVIAGVAGYICVLAAVRLRKRRQKWQSNV